MNSEKNIENNNKQYEIEYQIEQLNKLIEKLDSQLEEVLIVIESLKDVESLENDKEILFALHNGIFLKGKILNNDKVFLNVGNGVIVEKNFEETINLMRKQYEEILNYKKELLMNLDALSSKFKNSK